MGVTVDEQGLTTTADAALRSGALRTDDGCVGEAGRGATQTSSNTKGWGRSAGPGLPRSSYAVDVVHALLRRVATFAAYARARLDPSAAATLSVLGKVRDRSCPMRRAGERHEFANVPTFEEAAEIARKEWLRAISYFDEVVDPDLIDYATYSLRAAERKYVYLLKKAREGSAWGAHTSTR